ncbi:MAG: Uncharacterised protein [Cryomorphaceae bacterium]|nr:MAG: Uncharacterised protein [Cryomorphaceae bacterium]
MESLWAMKLNSISTMSYIVPLVPNCVSTVESSVSVIETFGPEGPGAA